MSETTLSQPATLAEIRQTHERLRGLVLETPVWQWQTDHAIAVAWAAKKLGAPAKVVMFKGANPYRMQRCRDIGAELIVAENVAEAFEMAGRIQSEEGRYFVHPFEGPLTALGTATIGLEFYEQVGDLDAVIIPIGGGGLAAGMSMAIKLCNPNCQVFGVEPEGADTMYRSLPVRRPRLHSADLSWNGCAASGWG